MVATGDRAMIVPPRQGIPFRPDPGELARSALRTVARAALAVARTAGKWPSDEKHPWPDDRAIEWLTRSPVTPTRTSDAAALAQVKLHWIASLVPASAAAAVLDESIQASFDGAYTISVPGVSLPTAGWAGENMAIPVLQGTTSAATLAPSKLAAIIALTREMIESSDAEAIMQQVLLENIGASLDAAFFNSNAAVANTSPAGILNGAISVTPAAAGSGAMVADISALAAAVAAVSGNSQMIIAAAPKQASALRLVAVDPPPIFASNALADKTVVGIVPAAIASANSTPVISVSRETTLHVASPAADLVVSPSTVAAPQKSMWQTDSLALRYTQELAWTKRGAGVAMITGANWP
jgi:hypothetical protein